MQHYVILLPNSTIRDTIRTLILLFCLIITNGYSSADSTGTIISIEPDPFHNFYLHPGNPPTYPTIATTRRLTINWTPTTTVQTNIDNQSQHHSSRVEQYEDYQQQEQQQYEMQQQEQQQKHEIQHLQQQQRQDEMQQQRQHQLFLLYHHLRTAEPSIDREPTIEDGYQPSDETAPAFTRDLIHAQAQLNIPIMQTSTESTTMMTTTFPSVSITEPHPPPDFYLPQQSPRIINDHREQQDNRQQYPSFKLPETGQCIDGPSLPIKCDPKRPWPSCPPQSYCYATNSVDVGPYFCCPVWSTRGSAWRPAEPFYNHVPEIPDDWPDIVKLTANWPHSIYIPKSLQRSEPMHKINNNQQQSVSHEESNMETPVQRRIQGYIRRWLRRMAEQSDEK